MSIYISESNASAKGSAGATAIVFPAGASAKAANLGIVTGIFIRQPLNGYEGNLTYNILTRGLGGTNGNDGYIRLNQNAGTLTAILRVSSTQVLPAATLTGLPSNSDLLVMIIATAANVHLVACVPGSAPLINTTATTAVYTSNFAGTDLWSRISAGNSVSYGHYGPVEEAFYLTGLFPESGGVPDTTLIQNIANGTQSLATLDTQLTSGVKKWRYRMLLQDDLADAYGIAGNLTFTGTTVDKFMLSSGPIRPSFLTPVVALPMSSQVIFGTVGDTATALSDIRTGGGTYAGITPAAIHARLRKEDGTVLKAFQVIDPAPTGGTFTSGTFTSVPMTAGWLTCDFKAVDGGGAQLGDIVSTHAWKGSGFSALSEHQSQGFFLFATGNGQANPDNMRACITFLDTGGTPWRQKRLSPLNANDRVARGMKQACIEINTLFPGVPISFSTVGISGYSLYDWVTPGIWSGTWASFKNLINVIQPYVLYPMGHGNPTANYETVLGSMLTQAASTVGTPLANLHAGTHRYAGAGTSASYTNAQNARDGIRLRVIANPGTDFFASHPQVVKADSNDISPHPMDADVGQGRAGALYAWGLMMWCRAVEDTPLMITSAVKQSGGTQVKLVLGKVN